jgi:hypothetical protein
MATERQKKHMIGTTFLFTSKGHEAIWGTLSIFVFLDNWSWDLCLSSLELSYKARYQIIQAWVPLLTLTHMYLFFTPYSPAYTTISSAHPHHHWCQSSLPGKDMFHPLVLQFCRRKKEKWENKKHDTLTFWGNGSFAGIYIYIYIYFFFFQSYSSS